MNGDKRTNSRGVDINRNFNYGWSQYQVSNPEYDYKGTAPESEVETQYVVNTINSLDNVVAFLDFHNMFKSTSDRGFVIYDSTYERARKDIADIVAANFPDLYVEIDSTTNPSALNYFPHNNIYSCNPEFVIGGINSNMFYGSDEMTSWLEFAANLVILYAQSEKPSYILNKEPFNYHFYRSWGSSGLIMNLAQYTEMDFPTVELEIPCDGILKVDYSVVYKSSNDINQALFTPLLGQAGTSFRPNTVNREWEVYQDSLATNRPHSIAFSAAIPVKRSGELAKVGIYAMPTGGTIYINRARMNVTFIPSFGKGRQRNIESTSTGFIDKGFYVE